MRSVGVQYFRNHELVRSWKSMQVPAPPASQPLHRWWWDRQRANLWTQLTILRLTDYAPRLYAMPTDDIAIVHIAPCCGVSIDTLARDSLAVLSECWRTYRGDWLSLKADETSRLGARILHPAEILRPQAHTGAWEQWFLPRLRPID